jgi:hypothetical protein
MITGVVLVVLAVALRLLSAEYHWWNLVPMGAVALYSGARLPRRWAWAIPVIAMMLSDALLDHGRNRPVFEPTRWTVYATLSVTAALGLLARGPRMRAWMVPGLSLLGSTVFFLTTNFATWAEGQLYPLNWAGLVECYVQGIPFHRNTMLTELLGTCVLFGVGPLVERAATRLVRGRSGAGVGAEQTPPVEISEIR